MDGEELIERLKRRFGLGTKPQVRLALYHRLALLVEEYGDPCLVTITEAAMDATGKNDEDKWFCKVVIRRLMERKVIKVRGLD